MRLRVEELRLGLEHTHEDILLLAAARLCLPRPACRHMRIVRQALDARRKQNISFVYTIDVEVDENQGRQALDRAVSGVSQVPVSRPRQLVSGQQRLAWPPVVVGAGPAGLFAALALARWGYRPLLLERGRDIERRTRDVESFWAGGGLDPCSNVQFGEGGAGTFSDGKLTTRIKDERVRDVLDYLVEAGAPPEIAYLQKPHIGTDRLRSVVARLRQRLLAMGGQVRFESRVSRLLLEHRRVVGVVVNDDLEIPAGAVVLAIGHSARDTYEMLAGLEVAMETKPFAVGLRVEHPQAAIDAAQYGALAGHPRLGAAEYHLAWRSEEYGRNAYTFCMCPGGRVVAAASEQGGVVTNGMSEFARDSGVANSAVVVSVGEADFSGDGPLAGMEFQRQWERSAYRLGGGDYRAPAQGVGDFLADRVSGEPPVASLPIMRLPAAPFLAGQLSTIQLPAMTPTVPLATYRPGVVPANLRECLPKEVGETLAVALGRFDRQIRGFAGQEAVLTGVETRTSAPVRLVRDTQCCSLNTPGLYPAGEGAGYAGGIISAAVDGMRVAEAIIQTHALPEGTSPSQG